MKSLVDSLMQWPHRGGDFLSDKHPTNFSKQPRVCHLATVIHLNKYRKVRIGESNFAVTPRALGADNWRGTC